MIVTLLRPCTTTMKKIVEVSNRYDQICYRILYICYSFIRVSRKTEITITVLLCSTYESESLIMVFLGPF